jgi:CheY-like chemotaxis protein
LRDENGPRCLIVYVDDNPSSIALMADVLADFERVELVTAPTAELGIELVRARRPDVIIMDINLPGMSGFEATQKLAESPDTRDIPVLALSAAAMIRDAARVAGAGFYRYLTKPVRVDELTAVLEELLDPALHDGRPRAPASASTDG